MATGRAVTTTDAQGAFELELPDEISSKSVRFVVSGPVGPIGEAEVLKGALDDEIKIDVTTVASIVVDPAKAVATKVQKLVGGRSTRRAAACPAASRSSSSRRRSKVTRRGTRRPSSCRRPTRAATSPVSNPTKTCTWPTRRSARSRTHVEIQLAGKKLPDPLLLPIDLEHLKQEGRRRRLRVRRRPGPALSRPVGSRELTRDVLHRPGHRLRQLQRPEPRDRGVRLLHGGPNDRARDSRRHAGRGRTAGEPEAAGRAAPHRAGEKRAPAGRRPVRHGQLPEPARATARAGRVARCHDCDRGRPVGSGPRRAARARPVPGVLGARPGRPAVRQGVDHRAELDRLGLEPDLLRGRDGRPRPHPALQAGLVRGRLLARRPALQPAARTRPEEADLDRRLGAPRAGDPCRAAVGQRVADVASEP